MNTGLKLFGTSGPLAVALLVALAWACGRDDGGPTVPLAGPALELGVTVVASGLGSPVHLTAPPGDPRLFVVELPGTIRIVEGDQLLTVPFLDIRDRVGSAGGEQGLFSVAFHPSYASNGFFYVDYTDRSGATRVERYSVTADPSVADPGSAALILQVAQPFSNHNGGQVTFGEDGMLYIGLGDGGGGGDPLGHGQDRSTLLGSLLRIDVDGGFPYAIPPDNPFAGDPAARGEIWAYGLRNPWRFAFDRAADVLYIADVGQSSLEEVNAVAAGLAGVNYGWNIMEGTSCFSGGSCDRAGLTLPVLEYDHGQGCSVTGGLVYRGSAMPGVVGRYFYSDFCAGWLRSFRLSGVSATELREWEIGDVGNVLSFGEDSRGELYILSGNGSVYRLVQTN
ncbi:MAG: PQQ-dependent sugar dehydrogenase [Gemmatimonadota bacterium]